MRAESLKFQEKMNRALVKSLDQRGSTLFSMRWKVHLTPALRPFLARQVSAARTSGSGFTSWPSPQVADTSGGGQAKRALEPRSRRGVADTLTAQSGLAGWATPSKEDAKRDDWT